MQFGCGKSGSGKVEDVVSVGFSPNYIPPVKNYIQPESRDPYFKKLSLPYSDPYWTRALLMDDGEEDVGEILFQHENILVYAFPSEAPDYLPVEISGWSPANEKMKLASREIFSKLEKVLDVKIEETESVTGLNVLSISQSIQASSAGFSFFPNNFYYLGSDIFISKNYSNPLFLSGTHTNYDYEILVHEIGHALGLKHPFESDRSNDITLTDYEDQTKFTAMSYDEDPNTFDGTFRVLDWMALTEFYGVNPSYNNANNVYTFSDDIGVFIIDGSGVDQINAGNSNKDIFLDLRSGTHSYEGQFSSKISDPNQLTISHGSDIENIILGRGNDNVIGNNLPNVIETSEGNDLIYPSEGADVINSGPGFDAIDLSEEINTTDKLIFNVDLNDLSHDLIYGFRQGAGGDVLQINNTLFTKLHFLPLIEVENIPKGIIDGCIVRVAGSGLNSSTELANSFNKSGLLNSLRLNEDFSSLVLTANSQATGEGQNLYYAENEYGIIEVNKLATFVGNYLDIDTWSTDNFVI